MPIFHMPNSPSQWNLTQLAMFGDTINVISHAKFYSDHRKLTFHEGVESFQFLYTP